MTRRIPFYMEVYTPEDVEDFERTLAREIAMLAEETDLAWRETLAEWVAMDTAWLVEMREAVFPSLPFRLPVGLPAPRPVREVGR
jgi:hypothetical protein